MNNARRAQSVARAALMATVMTMMGCTGPRNYLPAQICRIVDGSTLQPLAGVVAKVHIYRVPYMIERGYVLDYTSGPTGTDGLLLITKLDRHAGNTIDFVRDGYLRSNASIGSDTTTISAPVHQGPWSGWPDRVVKTEGIINIPMYREGEAPTTRPATQAAGPSDAHSSADFQKNRYFHEKTIDVLATIDPVKIARSDYGGVPSNVKKFWNRYETDSARGIGFNILGVWIEPHGYAMPSLPGRSVLTDDVRDLTGGDTLSWNYPEDYPPPGPWGIDHWTIIGTIRMDLVQLLEG